MVVPGSCYPGVAAGMAALQIFYNLSTGLWNTTEWWHAANAMETTIDYSTLTDTITYRGNIFNTFEKHKGSNFLNRWFYDDEGWWALTWIKAYDLTGETRYLDMAKTIFNDMKGGWDSTCGDSIWWKKERKYKNAITNELFLSVAARLHLRSPGDKGPGSYLDWAKREWNWFKNTGLINSSHLINDGLNSSCQNNGHTTRALSSAVWLICTKARMTPPCSPRRRRSPMPLFARSLPMGFCESSANPTVEMMVHSSKVSSSAICTTFTKPQTNRHTKISSPRTQTQFGCTATAPISLD